MHVKDEDLTEKLGEGLDAPLEAAVYARVDTPLGAARWLTPIGNYLVARPAARASARRTTERTEVPLDAAVVLGVGGGQLQVWSADPMLSQVKDHLGSVPLERIEKVEARPGASWWPVEFTMSGGESFELEARGDVRAFAEACGRGSA